MATGNNLWDETCKDFVDVSVHRNHLNLEVGFELSCYIIF